ncbi:MAG: DUF3313 domain-containing protein [Proteobacteria bacterium]|nr:DUF3313 domain-containing protein [Pseudomonadota bacterium]
MKKVIFIVILLSLIAFGAGYADEPKKYPGLESSSQLQPQPSAPETLIFKKEGVDAKKYIKFLFDSVEIYQGPDAGFGGVSLKDINTVADFMKSEFVRVLQGKYAIVDKPGTDVLRIKLTLAGIEITRPALAVMTRIIPVGLALNLGKSATGMQGSFTGSVTCAGEFFDSETNTLLYAFLTKRGPNAMDVTVVLTGLDASKKAITEIAEKFIETVDRVQGVVKK